MATVDKIRNGLIDKILSIQNKDFLVPLDKIISASSSEGQIIKLSEDQKQMLQLSEEDCANSRLISHHEMDKHNLEWLNAR